MMTLFKVSTVNFFVPLANHGERIGLNKLSGSYYMRDALSSFD